MCDSIVTYVHRSEAVDVMYYNVEVRRVKVIKRIICNFRFLARRGHVDTYGSDEVM